MHEIPRDLEKQYYAVLQDIARQQGVPTVSVVVLPSLLESSTLWRLHPARVWFISGMSGSGKSTIIQTLSHAGYDRLVNVITRSKRAEEKETDNLFTDDAKFFEWQSKGLLFQPHKTNGVWHAILKTDIQKALDRRHRLYTDKSIRSTLEIIKEFPSLTDSNFLYILPPSFEVLYKRLTNREKRQDGKSLTEQEIRDRIQEEITDMERSVQLKYVYLLNDAREQVQAVLKNILLQNSEFEPYLKSGSNIIH